MTTDSSSSHQGDVDRFIWRDRDCTTLGALSSALQGLRDEASAADFWRAYVEFLSRPTARLARSTPQEAASSNIGYMTGYWGPEERQRVLALFPQAQHPIFGRFETEPTAEQALEAGKRAAFGEFR